MLKSDACKKNFFTGCNVKICLHTEQFAGRCRKLNTLLKDHFKYEVSIEKLTNIIKKFENHPSIMKIKSKYAIQEKFSVKPVTVKDVENIIKNIPNNKASGGEIPLNILKQSRFTYEMLTDYINAR